MRIAEQIKQARDGLGLTQEQLAERLDVSRQSVSKWEMGISVPSPENLKALSEILGVPLSQEEQPENPGRVPPSPWKGIALALGGLLLLAAAGLIFLLSASGQGKGPENPEIRGIYFYDETGAPLRPDLGDGWCAFTAGQRVILLVEFQNGSENGVIGTALFLTPTGTETYDQRQQLAVQAVTNACSCALFVLEIPEDMTGHLDVTLECSGDLNVTETLNVTSLSP